MRESSPRQGILASSADSAAPSGAPNREKSRARSTPPSSLRPPGAATPRVSRALSSFPQSSGICEEGALGKSHAPNLLFALGSKAVTPAPEPWQAAGCARPDQPHRPAWLCFLQPWRLACVCARASWSVEWSGRLWQV